MQPTAGGISLSSMAPAGELTVEDYRRLSWLRATRMAAEHLAARGRSADRGAARRLTFGLWLRATGRLDGEFTCPEDR